MATGVAESVDTDKYKRFGGDILTIQAHWGQDASINKATAGSCTRHRLVLAAPLGKTVPGSIWLGTDNITSSEEATVKFITA